ncbi:hypothetical protein [Photobacterium damselae]|uniref:hypothetical protein n=1 Tax=Photobacterium damselae TaxID=38293 RepID=UPI001EDFB0B5
MGLAGGLNNYQYVPNPVNWVDPLELSACPLDDKSASKLDHLADQWKTENTPPINRNLSGVAGSVLVVVHQSLVRT